jgi:sugar/nucleoside kinase (ribokinase family)
VGGAAVILVVGDVVDDVVVRPLAPFAAGTDTPAAIEPHPGGQGANTAAWLGALGAPVRFAGRVGAGDAERHAAALAAHGVDARLAADPGAPTGRLVVIAGDRSMFTDRGANARLSAGDLGDDLLDGVTHLHVSGYALVESGPREAVLGLVRRAGVPWSVDPGSAAFVAGTPFLRWTAGAAICFPNQDEAEALGEGLATAYERVVLKRGAEGLRVLRAGAVIADLPAVGVRAIDPTGAGDALAAGFLAARLRGEGDEACARAAASAAARAVARAGARPPRR